MKPDIPDRTFKIVGRDPDGTPHLRPCHDGMTVCEDDEFVTLRSWFVGDDGLTPVERDVGLLRNELTESNASLRRIARKVDDWHAEVFGRKSCLNSDTNLQKEQE